MDAIIVDDPDLLSKSFKLRHEVFVEEQEVPPDLEWDDDDRTAVHACILDRGEAVATGRLVIHGAEGKIGRMAVKKNRRGEGLGREILRKLIAAGREMGVSSFYLHAQVHAKEFYSREGFTPTGGIFDEAGIPHVKMILTFD